MFVAGWLCLLVFAWSSGCADSDQGDDTRTAGRPLSPLVYTEDPDHSPEAAEVRDQRLMRQLLHGSDESGSWGSLDDNDDRGGDIPELRSADNLGQVAYRAIIGQSDRHWDHLFVDPNHYASLVDVELARARRYVDDKQARARRTARQFQIEKTSEAPSGGLDSLFEFERLELGDGRTLQGDVVGEDEEAQIAQHWNNRLVLGLADSDVEFHLAIRKILRTPVPGTDQTRLGVASDIDIGRRLRVFLEAGMHLKPSILQSYAYPFPLEVGNFWRYARRLAGTEQTSSGESSEALQPGQLPDALHASRVTIRVESVDRYETRRLVHLRFIYNDADLTRRNEYWLVTPRQIFFCPRPCRRNIDDLDWTLRYLQRQTPLFHFPLSRGDGWGSSFTVREEWKNLEVPGGSFFGTLAIEGVGPLDGRVPFHRLQGASRYFAPSKGVVKRRYRVGTRETHTIVESLVDYRIMPR